jgi:hypothetical protein
MWLGAARGGVWINEFHYDNTGSDVDEYVEVVVGPDMAGVNLSDVTLSLYNGSNGEVYGAHTLDTFDVGGLVNGFQFYSLLIPGLQNGPDAFALDEGGGLIEFLSYEGSFIATNGPAAGVSAFDVGVIELTDTLIGSSLGLTGGPGTEAADFSWSLLEELASRGDLNWGQALDGDGGGGGDGGAGGGGGAIPEPHSCAVWLVLAVCTCRVRDLR